MKLEDVANVMFLQQMQILTTVWVQLTRIQFSGPEQAVTNARYMFVNDVNRKNMQMLEQQQQQMQVDFNPWTRPLYANIPCLTMCPMSGCI